MSNCQRCGASIALADVACRYCGAPHPEGIAFQRAEQARRESEVVAQATQQHYARTQADASVRRMSRHAFFWSLSSLPLCCLPVPGVVGILLAQRARKLARQHGLEVPGQALAALATSLFGFALCVAFYVFVILDSRALQARRQKLHSVVDSSAATHSLSQSTACALVELWLLENEFDGHTWGTSDHFDCPGKVEQQEERAKLLDIRIRHSSEAAFVATACLKRGARWMVQDIRRGNECAWASTEAAPPSASEKADSDANPVIERTEAPVRGSASAARPVVSRPRTAGSSAGRPQAPTTRPSSN